MATYSCPPRDSNARTSKTPYGVGRGTRTASVGRMMDPVYHRSRAEKLPADGEGPVRLVRGSAICRAADLRPPAAARGTGARAHLILRHQRGDRAARLSG